MEWGLVSEFRSARFRIHSSSCQRCERSHTTEPVRGGVSQKNAKGSALSTRYPRWRETMWNLYTAPGPAWGTNLSQIPEASLAPRGWALGSQPLKSPMTETRSALGAQTAK